MFEPEKYPLTKEGHAAFMSDPGSFNTYQMGSRLISASYELFTAQEKVQQLECERDMLLQRVECLRPKHPACSCKGSESGFTNRYGY